MAEHYLYALAGAHSLPITGPLPRPLLCFQGWPLKWGIPAVEMACGTGQPGAVSCSSWELCWLSAHAGHDVNPTCSSPTQPLETASTDPEHLVDFV